MIFVFGDCANSAATTILDDMLLIVFGAAVAYFVQLPGNIRARNKRKTYVKLSGFWESGVRVLNDGMHKLSAQKRRDWYDAVEAWQQSLYEVVENSLPEKLGIVRTVGLFPTIQPYDISDKKAVNKLSELWETLQKLQNLLDEYSPK